MRFPNGCAKALTLSYDDGVEQDIHLIEILNKYDIKATFNINSGLYPPDGTVFEEGTLHRRLSHSAALALYKNSAHEVAVHTFSHPWLEQLPQAMAASEVINDRINHENDYETPVRGMAYPYGTFNDTVVEILKNAGIVYSRTVVSTKKFNMPKDWLRLDPTCKHTDPELMSLASQFAKSEFTTEPKLFYLWGHSFEFERDDNWGVIEEFCEFISGRSDIWYATNIEIYEYTEAYNRLIWSADMSMVRNPSAIPVTFCLVRRGGERQSYTVAPNEVLKF